MTHDEAFLQAIIDSPDDDAPRLIYADWLEERGDPRGEFIRVQGALSRMDEYDPRRWDLMARERELLSEHGDNWLGLAPDLPEAWTYRRGFVDHLRISGDSFLAAGNDIMRTGPPPEIEFLGLAGTLARVLEHPAALRLRRITFSYADSGAAPLDTADVEALASSRLLSSLSALTVNGGIGPEAVRRMASATWLSNLRELRLPFCEIGRAGAETIFSCTGLAGLRELDLTRTNLTAAAMEELASARHLNGLKLLYLGQNEIDAAGVRSLALNPRFSSIEELALGNNPLGDEGIAQLCRSAHLCGLKSLWLRGTRIQAPGLRILARSALAAGLTKLGLSHNYFLGSGTPPSRPPPCYRG